MLKHSSQHTDEGKTGGGEPKNIMSCGMFYERLDGRLGHSWSVSSFSLKIFAAGKSFHNVGIGYGIHKEGVERGVQPTEIRTSISPSSAVEPNTISALANYATEADYLKSLNHQWSSQDDIFIDDDGAALEGSGAGHHEVKDDLESSGSGYGPDDEDGDGGSDIVHSQPKHENTLPVNEDTITRSKTPMEHFQHHKRTSVLQLPLCWFASMHWWASHYRHFSIGKTWMSIPFLIKICLLVELFCYDFVAYCFLYFCKLLSESLPPDSKNENDHPGVGLGPENTQTDNDSSDNNHHSNGVYIMNRKPDERATSFFAQPGILAAVIGGAVVGLLCAILVVMFIVYRMRKKDEGSYALDEPKRSPTVNSYTKNSNHLLEGEVSCLYLVGCTDAAAARAQPYNRLYCSHTHCLHNSADAGREHFENIVEIILFKTCTTDICIPN
uniref:Syndecan n=1 Tax=Timema californicum TaxID=61474 RepID=A0A7R9P7M6_TIMCA|nr:unnamed protein product [Timema californicum]